MTLYPEIEPYDHGMLDVGDGHHVYWETCGNPYGKPAVVLHGGPGSGCRPGWRRYFDPAAYRVVLFDQRGCGRSTPHASDPSVDLSTNTTHHLIADTELLRRQLGVERWLVLGGSWGSTLALAYAERFPSRVSELVLFSVVTTTSGEVEWVTQAMRRFFPSAWRRFRDGVPATGEDAHVSVRADSVPDPRYRDARFRMCFARLVTHYWSHAAWLEDGELIRNAGKLAGIPGALVHGRLDVSGPPDIAWQLSQVWPGSSLTLVDDAGHGTGHPDVASALVGATDRFAGHQR